MRKSQGYSRAKNINKWELNLEGLNKLEQLKQNEELAKSYMLPKETKVVDDKRLLLNYFSNQVKNKVGLMMNDNYKDLWEHLMEVANENKNATTKALSNWDNLIDHLKKIEFKDDDDEPEVREDKGKAEAKVLDKPGEKQNDSDKVKIDKINKPDLKKEDKKIIDKNDDKKIEDKKENNDEKLDSKSGDLLFGHLVEPISSAINNNDDLFDNIFETIDTNKIPKADSFT